MHQNLPRKVEESRESCKVTQGNRAGQEWSVTRGNAIGVGGSQIAGTVGGRAASQAEVREGSEADLQNRGKTRNVRRKNVPVVNVIGHRRTGLALTSSRVVEEEEDLVTLIEGEDLVGISISLQLRGR